MIISHLPQQQNIETRQIDMLWKKSLTSDLRYTCLTPHKQAPEHDARSRLLTLLQAYFNWLEVSSQLLTAEQTSSAHHLLVMFFIVFAVVDRIAQFLCPEPDYEASEIYYKCSVDYWSLLLSAPMFSHFVVFVTR